MSRKKKTDGHIESIARELRELRGKGRTQAEFAGELGVALRTYSRYERGERETPEAIIRLARIISKGSNGPIPKRQADYDRLMEWMDRYPCHEALPSDIKAKILKHFNGAYQKGGGGGNRWSGDHGINVVGDKNLINGD